MLQYSMENKETLKQQVVNVYEPVSITWIT